MIIWLLRMERKEKESKMRERGFAECPEQDKYRLCRCIYYNLTCATS